MEKVRAALIEVCCRYFILFLDVIPSICGEISAGLSCFIPCASELNGIVYSETVEDVLVDFISVLLMID